MEYSLVDPVCHANSAVILVYDEHEDHRCLQHAAYDLAGTLCKQISIQKADASKEAFNFLRSFFKTYLSIKFLPQTTENARTS